MPPDLGQRIRAHITFFTKNEKPDFDKALSFFRGRFWADGKGPLDRDSGHLYGEKNIIYPVVDSATSNLLGPNPQVAPVAKNIKSQEMAGPVSALMDWAIREGDLRSRAQSGITDAVLCKRGIFKVVWDKARDRPAFSVPHPSTVFFDLTARHNDEIRYWIHAVTLTEAQFTARVNAKKYRVKEGPSAPVMEVTPDWMTDTTKRDDMQRFMELEKRYLVFEYYDVETGEVCHYHLASDTVLYKDKYSYLPFSMFTLNANGVDCLGLSDVHLILPQQASINHMMTLLKRLVYMQLPKKLYDAGIIDSKTLNKALQSEIGSFIPVDTSSMAGGMRNLAQAFVDFPMPQIPEVLMQYIERLEADAAFTSALMEAARGQVANAQTATEMEIIYAQLRGRLATREAHLNAAMEKAAWNAFYLMQRFMKTPKMVRISGSTAFHEVGVETLAGLKMGFTMVPYNPIRQNPAVRLETLQSMLPILGQFPNIDLFAVAEELVNALGLPNRILIPEWKARKDMEEQQALAAQMAQGGAAGAAPPAGAPPAAGPPPAQAPSGDPTESAAVARGDLAQMPPELQAAIGAHAMDMGTAPPR
jgi:hypothetical protein